MSAQVMLDAFLSRSDEEFEMFQGKQQKLEETQAQIASAKAALAQEKQKLSSMLDDLDLAESQVSNLPPKLPKIDMQSARVCQLISTMSGYTNRC